MPSLEASLFDEARRLGFSSCGIAPAADADGFARFREWLDDGFAGEMTYLGADPELRRHPRSIVPGVRSVVAVTMSYAPRFRNEDCIVATGAADAPTGRIARYARSADYHLVLRERLKALGAWVQLQRPGSRARSVIDSAPLLERDFARRAGLGWFGKNTMLIDTRLGSWTVLGALLVDIDLAPSVPFEANHCGTCTACLDACPTQAFPEPGRLDARRCISYLNIELKEHLADEQRAALGDWIFGCDVCNDVCPWNRKALPGSDLLAPRADLAHVDPVELLGLSEGQFRERFAGTALHPRPGRRVVLRNAAIVLGNKGDELALPALRRALGESEEIIREAARWAIGRIERRRGE